METNLELKNLQQERIRLTELVTILNNLLNDVYDDFEIIALSRKYDNRILQEGNSTRQRNLLQYFILENITEEDSSSPYYANLLEQTRRLCNGKDQCGYKCCLMFVYS